MISRFVLDGSPGSGKSTLIFGKSDSEHGDIHHPCLSDSGYVGMPESAAKAFYMLKHEGKDPEVDFEGFLSRIVHLEREKYLVATEGSKYFYDRSFHHWIHFRNTTGVMLPLWYDAFNAQIRYSEPIFLLKPILTYDMTVLRESKTRTFTLQERLESYERNKKIYLDLGYEIVEIPVLSQDVDENSRKRMNLILTVI